MGKVSEQLADNFPWSLYQVDLSANKIITLVYLGCLGEDFEVLRYIDQGNQRETHTIKPDWIDNGGGYYRKRLDALMVLRLHVQGQLYYIDDQIKRLGEVEDHEF
jgi:hypothetical protein